MDIITETLRWVNDIRAVINAEPLDAMLPGRQGAVCSCPVAVSLNHKSHADFEVTTEAFDQRTEDRYELSARVAEFVEAFDNGEFPELIAS